MITLFRRIRQKLIDSGNITKYLLYAIGEILLVVIGILIALQVNNWNEGQANKAKEYSYLTGIHSDLIRQIESLNRTIAVNKAAIETSFTLLEQYRQDGRFSRSDKDSTLYKINVISRSAAPGVIKTSFSELMFGGNISLIHNENLRNQIVLFYQELDDMIDASNNNASVIFQRQLLPVFNSMTLIDATQMQTMFTGIEMDFPTNLSAYSEETKELAFINLEDTNKHLEFLNALNLKVIIEGLQRSRSLEMIDSAQDLMALIEEEIQKRHQKGI